MQVWQWLLLLSISLALLVGALIHRRRGRRRPIPAPPWREDPLLYPYAPWEDRS